MSRTIHVGISIGDVNGIGPEVSLAAVHNRRWPQHIRFILVGSHSILSKQAKAFGFPALHEWEPTLDAIPKQKVSVWDPKPVRRLHWRPGRVLASASKAAYAWVVSTAAACMETKLQAMVTAPICKAGLTKASLPFSGHTEILAKLTRSSAEAMMLLGGPLRVVLVTRHIPLRSVARTLRRKAIADTIRTTSISLGWLGSQNRRIGVCALNPHGGEEGQLGREELELISPAIQECLKEGIQTTGPIPADIIFHQAINHAYGAVVAMYHDQGLAPLKMLAFDQGVNLTLGLPIIRTSPDHGTAFDIAGKGKASAQSMEEAIRLALQLAKRQNPWEGTGHAS